MQRRVQLPAASLAENRREKLAGAAGALLLQLGFIAAFFHAFSTQAPPKELERELTFFLPRLLSKPAPAAQAPRAESAPRNAPLFVPPFLSIAPAPPAAPTDNAAILQNIGRALFGCAPENYTNLTPQQRALCPRLSEGVAIQDAPPVGGLPSQVKDNPHWANAMAHEKSPLLLPGASPNGGLNVLGLLSAIISGSITDPESFPTYIDPSQFMPQPVLKDEKATSGQKAGAVPK